MSKKTDSLDRKRVAMTEAFVAAIETAGKWLPDWICKRPLNFITGKAYRGINCIMLPSLTIKSGWTSPYFAGKGQIKSAGGRIKDEEFRNGSWVFFWGRHTTNKIDPATGEQEERTYWFPKAYQVWNLEQTEGVKESRIKIPTATEVDGAKVVEKAEALLTGYMDAEGIKAVHSDPCYIPMLDAIGMPPREDFMDTEGYYNALAHECGHSTGAADRLGRDLSGMKGDHKYSREELVAQMTAAFVRAEVGIITERGEQRDAAYLASWLDAMKADPAMLFDAAQDAEKALQYMRKAAGVAEDAPETADPVEAK